MLGVCYQYGQGVKTKDMKTAIEYYETAANKGDIMALETLGEYYMDEDNPEKDYEKAADYFMTADGKGFAHATYNLALCYYNGRGTELDRDYAQSLLEKAANKGDEDAQEFLNTHFNN